MLRQVTAIAILGLGIWLSYEALHAVIVIVNLGSPVSNALLDPPTGLIRIVGAAFMVLGGLMAALSQKGGAIVATVGAIIILGLSGLMAGAGADSSLWMKTFLQGIAATLLAVLILSLRRD